MEIEPSRLQQLSVVISGGSFRDSQSSCTSEQENMEDLMLMEQQQKQVLQIIRNNFTLLLILNIINSLFLVFSLTFYMWYQLTILVQTVQDESIYTNQTSTTNEYYQQNGYQNKPIEQRHMNIWLNLLFVLDNSTTNSSYMSFESYKSSESFICNSAGNKDYCSDQLDYMSFLGQFCCGLLGIGLILLGIDLFRLFRLRQNPEIHQLVKACWLHPLILSIQLIGFFSYFLVVLYNQYVQDDILFNVKGFGGSFWVGIVSIIINAVLAIYYRKTKTKQKSSQLVRVLINRIHIFQKSVLESHKGTIN